MNAVFIRSFAILASFVIGYSLPCLNAFDGAIRWFIVAMLFITFLGLKFRKVRLDRRHYLIVAFNLVIGCGTYLFLQLSGLGHLSEAGFFAGITPTATAAPVIMGFLGGNVEFVTASLLFDNAVISALLPVLLPWVVGKGGIEVYWHVAQSVLFVMGMPLALALLVRRVYPRSFVWPRKLKNFSFGLWVAVLCLIVAHASHDIHYNSDISPNLLWQIGLVSAVICALNFYVGYLIGGPGRRRECSQSLGQKNTTLTIVLAMMYANPIATLGPTFYVLWHNLWNSWQLYRTAKRAAAEKSPVKPENGASR